MKIAAFACLLLSGCAHGPDILEIGEGRYSLSATAHVNCHGGSREEAVSQAKEFCEARHATAVIDTFDDQGSQESLAGCSTSIVFRCTNPH